MPKPEVKLKLPKGGEVVIGVSPRVVGVLSSLPEKVWAARDIPSDLIEMRLDQVQSRNGWQSSCQAIEQAGVPVLLTIRSKTEGGNWSGSETERLKLYEEGLAQLALVDVEFKSEIARQVADAARSHGKACILSYHNFEGTPETSILKRIITEAQELASIVKISAMAKTENDVATLRALLNEQWKTPLCDRDGTHGDSDASLVRGCRFMPDVRIFGSPKRARTDVGGGVETIAGLSLGMFRQC